MSSFDLIVVGSGIAGSTAALAAVDRGAKVALLEKSSTFGGSSALSAGMYWTAPSLDAYRRRIPNGDPALGEHVVTSFDAGRDLISNLGVRISDEATRDIMTFGIGYSFDVRDYLEKARARIAEADGVCLTDTSVTGLVMDGERVAGVTASSDGKESAFSAGAVVLATGGFQASEDKRSQYIPNAEALVFRSNPGSTGDSLDFTSSIGIDPVGNMASFYGHLLPYPLQDFTPDKFLAYSQYYSEATVLLNLEGKRFIDERLGDEILNQAILDQPQGRGVMIFDDWVRRNEATSEPFPGLGLLDRYDVAEKAGGQVARADTLEGIIEAVGKFGVDAGQAEQTLESYLQAIELGKNFADGVTVSPTARPPQDGPFYAVVVQPSITFTFGGVPVDAEGHVLRNGQPVPGLYAAGADIGGLSDVGYTGGLAPALLTGHTAGTTATTEND